MTVCWQTAGPRELAAWGAKVSRQKLFIRLLLCTWRSFFTVLLWAVKGGVQGQGRVRGGDPCFRGGFGRSF